MTGAAVSVPLAVETDTRNADCAGMMPSRRAVSDDSATMVAPVSTTTGRLMPLMTALASNCPYLSPWWAPRRLVNEALLGAVETVTCVAKARHYVAVIVEVLVDGGGENGHVGLGLLQTRNPLRRGEQAHEPQVARAAFLERADRGRC